MDENDRMNTSGTRWKYFFRQVLICSGAWTIYFTGGLIMGTSTVLVPQLRQEANSTDAVTSEEASALRVAYVYGALPWDIFLPIMTSFLGRRITVVIINLGALIGNILFYYSSNVHQIILTELLYGPALSCTSNFLIMLIAEYSAAEWRGLFLTIKTATFFWGVLVANTIGTFFHWKNIPLIGVVFSSYGLLTIVFWPESPFWLASKGRFDECTKAHKWLKGSCLNSDKELKDLSKLLIGNDQNKKPIISQVSIIIKSFSEKEFYKPTSICVVLISLYLFSGKLVCTAYALEILKLVTNDTSLAYIGMLILDAFTVLSMYISCVMAKFMKRRTLLLSSAVNCALHLLILALYLYLNHISVLTQNVYVSLSLITGYSVSMAATIVLAPSITGEILPIKSKYLAICVTSLYLKCVLSFLFEVSPSMFNSFHMFGTFLLFGVTTSIFAILVYIYLPETKDKTLHEISDIINGIESMKETKELLPNERNKITIP